MTLKLSKVYRVPDVEDFRDFYQYYRGGHRWFGLAQDREEDPIIPCQLRDASDNGREVMVRQIVNGGLLDVTTNWGRIKTHGVFGAPSIGNHPIGNSYLSLKRSAVRESSKGLSIVTITGKLIDNEGYGRTNLNKALGLPAKHPVDLPTLDNHVEICGTVIPHIYNPTFDSAPRIIERMLASEIFGAPINYLVGLHFYKGNPNIRLVYQEEAIGYVEDDPDKISVHLDNPNDFIIHYLKNVFPKGSAIR